MWPARRAILHVGSIYHTGYMPITASCDLSGITAYFLLQTDTRDSRCIGVSIKCAMAKNGQR